MNHWKILRVACYLLGLVVLAAGLTLNTKTTLGVSPIVSVAYCASELSGVNLGDMTFLWFAVLVLLQIVLHLIRKAPNLKAQLLSDLSQLVVSLIATRFMNLFSDCIPVFETAYPDSFAGSLGGRFLFLLLAIVLTGVGASLSLFTRIAPMPADGAVQGIADFAGMGTGTTKNLVDLCCVLLTTSVSLLLARRLIGIGIGTLTAMLGVGRVVALVERLWGARLKALVEA